MKSELVLINSTDSFNGFSHYEDEPRIPLGLMSIAAWVEQHGYKTTILDCYASPLTIEGIISRLGEIRPIIVGINCFTPNCFVVYDLCREIKQALPEILLVLGGPHPSCAPEHVWENCAFCDYLIVGQGEGAFHDLLKHPSEGSRLCMSREQFEKHEKPIIAGLPVKLSDLPMPAYHLIDVEKYLSCEKQAYIASSRGCYYNCSFCCSKNVFNGCAEFRTSEQVLYEVDYLRKRYEVEHYYFYDDNILRWPELREFGKAMSAKGLTWSAQAAARDITEGAVESLKNSGCTRLSIGFESGASKIQAYIGKVLPSDTAERIRKVKMSHIAVRGYFMVGFPDETKEDVVSTAKLICELRRCGLSDLCIFATRPYPGTRLYEDCIRLFGEDGLDKFEYLDDYLIETDPFVRAKLKTYNTIGTKQICKCFTPVQIRALIRGLYHVFEQTPDNEDRLKELLFMYL